MEQVPVQSDYQLNTAKLSVVMPAYNEAQHIYDNLLSTSRQLTVFAKDYEILVVNDGSKDNTEREALRAAEADSHIRVLSYSPNRGKGGAIKEGILNAEGELIAFCDADLDLSPSHLRDFLSELEKQQADVVIGSKMHKDSNVDYPLSRKIMSLGYYCLLRMLFHLHTKDTQTGIKLFTAETIKPIIEKVETNGFAFDIEILAHAVKNQKKIIERPITLNFTRATSGGSRIGVSDIVNTFKDTLKIRKRIS